MLDSFQLRHMVKFYHRNLFRFLKRLGVFYTPWIKYQTINELTPSTKFWLESVKCLVLEHNAMILVRTMEAQTTH